MYHYFQGMLSIWHQEQKIFLSDLILIAILVNNAFKTVQQSAKDKEDICRRADARQGYLTQDFTPDGLNQYALFMRITIVMLCSRYVI